MMSQPCPVEVEASGIIDAPLERVWNLVSNFNNVGRWHPDVTSSVLDVGSGKETGSERTVRLRNGMTIRERLIAIASHDHFYTYSVIESPLPMRNHESKIRLVSVSNFQTRVIWTARFEVLERDAKTFGESVKNGVLETGIEGLRQAALGVDRSAQGSGSRDS